MRKKGVLPMSHDHSYHAIHSTRELGENYAKGRGVLQDLCAAVELYRQATEEGDGTAAYLLGQCYFQGAGVKRDYQKAQEYYLRSDTIRAKMHLRRFFQDGKMWRLPNLTAFPGLERAVQEAAPGAFVTMGNLFFLGKVGYQDYEEGVRWYRCAGNDPEALFCLGFACAVGAGTPKDLRQAAAYFRTASQQDFLPATYNLLVCNRHGLLCDSETLTEREQTLARSFPEKVPFWHAEGFYSPHQLWVDRAMDHMTTVIKIEMSEQSGTDKEV
jgi:TPR repeat protein